MNSEENEIFVDRARDIPFNSKEVSVISKCSFWMKVIGYSLYIISSIIFLVAIGVFIISFSIIGKPEMFFSALIYLIISLICFILARSLYKSGLAFKDVINTSIDDQGFLVEGFTQLQHFFLILGILIFISVILLIILTIVLSFSAL